MMGIVAELEQRCKGHDAPESLPFDELAAGRMWHPDGSGCYVEDEDFDMVRTASAAVADYNVVCDGGCHGNPGQMYGSYQIRTRNGRSRIESNLQFEHGTNNVAEYKALLSALLDILERCEAAGVPTKRFSIAIRSDSQLMVNQINGVWGVNSDHLRPFFEAVHDELVCFKNWELSWVSREEVVRILGQGS